MAKRQRTPGGAGTDEGTAIRAAVYARLSVASPRSVSIAMQESELVREVEHRRWTFDPDRDLYIDEGFSGSKASVRRPAFERLMSEVRAGRYQRLVVWKLDRFSRRPSELHTTLELMHQHGCHLISLRDSIDSSTASGRLLIAVAAAVASIEVENTATRVLSTQEQLTQTGKWAGGPAPYGFRLAQGPAGRGTKLVVATDQARVIRKAATLIVEHNHGIGSAVSWLNAHRYLAGRERPWTSQALGAVLRRRALIGQHERAGRVALDPETGRPAAVHPPILEVGQFVALQQRLDEIRQHKTQGAGTGTLLAGLAFCGLCGGLLHGSDTTRSPRSNYRCRLRYDLHGACPGVSIKGLLLEQFVAERAVERLGAGGNVPLTADQWAAGRLSLTDAHLEERQRFVRAEMKRLQAERKDGKWDYPQGHDDWMELFQAYVREANELAEQAAATTASAGPPPSVYFPWKDAEEALATWRRLQQQDRRRTLGQLLHRVVVHPVGSPQRIGIEWRDDVTHRPEVA